MCWRTWLTHLAAECSRVLNRAALSLSDRTRTSQVVGPERGTSAATVSGRPQLDRQPADRRQGHSGEQVAGIDHPADRLDDLRSCPRIRATQSDLNVLGHTSQRAVVDVIDQPRSGPLRVAADRNRDGSVGVRRDSLDHARA